MLYEKSLIAIIVKYFNIKPYKLLMGLIYVCMY